MHRSFAVLGLVAIVGNVGCSTRIDPARQSVDTGTFGTTVVTLACKRIAYLESVAAHEQGSSDTVDVRGDRYRDVCRLGDAPPADAPPSLLGLHAKRPILVGAIDAVFPEGFLPDLQVMLTSQAFLDLYDNDTTLTAVDKAVELLDIMEADVEFAPALERLNHRLGYAPIDAGLGAVRAVVNYPGLHDFLLEVLSAVTEGGAARGEFDNLIKASAIALRHSEPAADLDDPERTGALLVELLLTEQDELGTSRPHLLVRRDVRGVAKVEFRSGIAPVPFADADRDGLADVDAIGRYVDGSGVVVTAPAPFELPAGEEQLPLPERDEQGRALHSNDGAPVYEYVDLDKTVFAAVMRDAVQLLDPTKGTAFDLARGASGLLGPREMVTRAYGDESITYRGFRSGEASLLDVLYGVLVLGTDTNATDLLALTELLVRDHEEIAARLIEAFISTARLADSFPEAQLEPGSPVFDELVPVIVRVLETPGLTEDLLRALEDPRTAEAGLRIAAQMKHRDMIMLDSGSQGIVGNLGTPVNRGMPDSSGNRSAFQRLVHLIADANGAQMCNKEDAVIKVLGIGLNTYSECELLRIDNLSVFYLQSMAYAKDGAGNVIYDDVHGVQTPRSKAEFPFEFGWISFAVTDDLMESMAGIEGFRSHPTPEALNRSIFLDPQPDFLADAMDPVRCKDGDRLLDAHNGTLMAFELDDSYDQLRPIIQAFADHDALPLLADIFSVLNNHYPSRESTYHQQSNPSQAGYSFASDISSYESLMVEILERRTLLDALVETAPTLNSLSANGRGSVDILTDTARFLFYPRAGLAKRDGSTTTRTEALASSASDDVLTLSPWYVLADAFKAKREALAQLGSEADTWQIAVSNTVDLFTRGDDVTGLGWQFRNQRFRGVALALIDFAQARLQSHDTAGDRGTWLLQDLPRRIEDVVAGPVFAGASDFVLSLQAAPGAREQLEALAAYLVDEVAHDEAFLLSLTALADVLQFALDDRDIIPVLRVAGIGLAPERGIFDAQLKFLKAVRASDEGQVLVRLVRNLFEHHRDGHTPAGDIVDALAAVHREHPYQQLSEPYTAADYRAAFRNVGAFLGDERRGLRKWVRIIQGRNL